MTQLPGRPVHSKRLKQSREETGLAPALPLPQDRSGLASVLGTLNHNRCLVCGWARRELWLETPHSHFLGLEVSCFP